MSGAARRRHQVPPQVMVLSAKGSDESLRIVNGGKPVVTDHHIARGNGRPEVGDEPAQNLLQLCRCRWP